MVDQKVSRQSEQEAARKTTHRLIHRFPLSDSDDIDNTSSQMADIFETDIAGCSRSTSTSILELPLCGTMVDRHSLFDSYVAWETIKDAYDARPADYYWHQPRSVG